LLLVADWVLPVSAPPLAAGGVRVEGAVITAVGPTAELRLRFPGDELRVFAGCVLLPGLVNVHTHLEYSAFHGFAPPSAFGPWMLRLLLARRRLSAEDYEVAARWGAYECVRCGVTTIGDCAYTGEAVARAARAAGLRARIYQEVFGLEEATLPDTMKSLEARIGSIREAGGPLVEPGVSPHAPYTVSARLYREAARFARRADLRLATHLAESPAEVELLQRGTGAIARAYRVAQLWSGQRWQPPKLSPVHYVSEAGALGPRTLAVHAVQVDEADLRLLAASGTAVAHCPRSNARLRCGVAPVVAMRQQGITVGLGTDSLASNDDLDLFPEMRAARRAAAGALTPEAVLRMATLEGAAALGWGHLIGSLEPGKQADLIVVRLPHKEGVGRTATSAGGSPSSQEESVLVVERLVEQARGSDVVLTMIAGQAVGQDRAVPAALAFQFRGVRARLSDPLAPRRR
jgi:cytosine/adenosine deaminase-related metal-dependent hydrolase